MATRHVERKEARPTSPEGRIAAARAQAAEEAKRAASGAGASFHKELWDSSRRLGVRAEDDPMVQDKNAQLKISQELFGRAHSPRQRAQYLADLIDGIPDGKVPRDAPSACTARAVVEKLDPPQIVPKMLITPTSPLRRLIVVQPPGAGKTCIMLDIMANFLTEDYNIIIVGDPDIFSSVRSDLRKCPARAPGGLLRERNKDKADPWCALYSNARREFFDPKEAPKDCEGGEKFGKARIYWLTHVLFGNWLKRKHAKYMKDDKDNIFKSNTLILMDEVHKLTAPSEERASPSWRESLLYVGEKLFEATRDPVPDKKLFVVGFTATPIIDDPVQAICLATVMKGHTDPSIFTDKAMTKLRIDPKKFYTPEYVEPVATIPVVEPGSGTERHMETEKVQEILREHRCIHVPPEKKGKAASDASSPVAHPCPVGAAERAKNLLSVYSLKPPTAQDLERLFANLFFVTNNTADPRKYPDLFETSRLVSYTPAFALAAADALKKHAGKLAWQEVSNFADPSALRDYVRRRLAGAHHTPEDSTMIEHNAPKWRSLAHDLGQRKDLGGKTAVYLGARTVSGAATSTDYLFGLSFYLQAKLGYRDGTVPGYAEAVAGEHRPATSPTIYMMADEAEEKDVARAKKAGGPDSRLVSVASKESRSHQLKAFNMSPCVGQVSGGDIATHYSVLLLGYEAYKALNLICVSNLVRMVLQPSGKELQTVGRARRSCAFAAVPKRDWRVNALTYIFHDRTCPDADCDCLLGSFFSAQAILQNQILRILRGSSIGCSNFKAYNQWPKGTTCLLDKDAPLHRTPEQQMRNFYFCSYSGAWGHDPTELEKEGHRAPALDVHIGRMGHESPTDHIPKDKAPLAAHWRTLQAERPAPRDYHQAPIRPGISGDVSPELVRATCAGRCEKLEVEPEEIEPTPARIPRARSTTATPTPEKRKLRRRHSHKPHQKHPREHPKEHPMAHPTVPSVKHLGGPSFAPAPRLPSPAKSPSPRASAVPLPRFGRKPDTPRALHGPLGLKPEHRELYEKLKRQAAQGGH
jgi:hypothetical protein